jgi:hypothetical protein
MMQPTAFTAVASDAANPLRPLYHRQQILLATTLVEIRSRYIGTSLGLGPAVLYLFLFLGLYAVCPARRVSPSADYIGGPRSIDHFADRIGVSNEIFALLMLELWDRNFADARLDYIV